MNHIFFDLLLYLQVTTGFGVVDKLSCLRKLTEVVVKIKEMSIFSSSYMGFVNESELVIETIFC